MKKTYHLIDHTADFGIQVFGSDSQELFTNAALALFDVITEMDVLKGDDSYNITASGEDWSDLMIGYRFYFGFDNMAIRHISIKIDFGGNFVFRQR